MSSPTPSIVNPPPQPPTTSASITMSTTNTSSTSPAATTNPGSTASTRVQYSSASSLPSPPLLPHPPAVLGPAVHHHHVLHHQNHHLPVGLAPESSSSSSSAAVGAPTPPLQHQHQHQHGGQPRTHPGPAGPTQHQQHHQLPPPPSPAAPRQVAEAREALVASIGNMLDAELHGRAEVLHANQAAIGRQQRDVERATDALRRENDRLARVASDASRNVLELGNVQNWAEVLERDFLVLEETVRLARGEGDGSSYGSSGSSWSGSSSNAGSRTASREGSVVGGEDDGDDVEMGGGVGGVDSVGQSTHHVDGGIGKGAEGNNAKMVTEYGDASDPMDLDVSPGMKKHDDTRGGGLDGQTAELRNLGTSFSPPAHIVEPPRLNVPGCETTTGALRASTLEAELRSAMDHPIDERPALATTAIPATVGS